MSDHARQYLDKQYNGVHTKKYNLSSFHYTPTSTTYHENEHKVNFGISSSNKYNIPSHHTTSHTTVKQPDSNFTPIPTNGRLDFKRVDINKFLSVHDETLDLQNYQGSVLQANGIHNDADMASHQAIKQGKEKDYANDPLAEFMSRPDVEGLITYNEGTPKKVTNTERMTEHDNSYMTKVKRVTAPPVVQAAFGQQEFDPTLSKEEKRALRKAEKDAIVVPENISDTIFSPKLTKEELKSLKEKAYEIESKSRRFTNTVNAATLKTVSQNPNSDVKKNAKVMEQYRKEDEKEQQEEHMIDQADREIHNEFLQEEKRIKLEHNKARQQYIKNQLKSKVRLDKRNGVTSEEQQSLDEANEQLMMSKEDKKEEKQEEKQEVEFGDDDIVKLADNFSPKERLTLSTFFKNHNIDTSQGIEKIQERLNKYLGRNYGQIIDRRFKEFKNPLHWFQRFLIINQDEEVVNTARSKTPVKPKIRRVSILPRLQPKVENDNFKSVGLNDNAYKPLKPLGGMI